MICYELKMFISAEEHIDAFRHFIKTDKLLPEMYKTQCTDFIHFFNRLLKLNDKNKKSIYEKEKLIDQLIKNGIYSENIKFLVFKNKVKKNEVFDYKVFTYKNINWNATFDSQDVNDFVNDDFDLLISYYDTEKAPLLLVTNLSKAKFKVGFVSIDKRLNHFMIDTNAENYTVFIDELFKYLKILNKL